MHENLVESYQNVINKNIMPKLLEQLGITDWTIELTPPREKSEADTLTVEKQRIDNALQMQQLGYEAIKDKSSELRFTFKKRPEVPGMQPGAPGGPPGMPGAPPMPPGAAPVPVMAGAPAADTGAAALPSAPDDQMGEGGSGVPKGEPNV